MGIIKIQLPISAPLALQNALHAQEQAVLNAKAAAAATILYLFQQPV